MALKLFNLNSNEHNQDEEPGLKVNKIPQKDIAVIGISVRFPMTDTIEKLWDCLCSEVDMVRQVPEYRKRDIESYLRLKGMAGASIKYNVGAYLDEIDKFDYQFFRLSPREASLMDPNQRIFLETAWNAVKDAGYGGKKLSGSRTGVYAGFGGMATNKYLQLISEAEPDSMYVALAGNLPSVIPSRISYLLDMKGPSMIVDTACSSSLVAIHLACQGIRSGDCELAIAGSVNLNLLPVDSGQRLGIESSDGRAKTFDESSDGTGIGEGAAAVVLKSLPKAIRDGDNIYAVIKGSAINQDGSSIGITAPNATAQEDVIINAWENAEIDPTTITYIEAHGTGTKLGDPIEIEGIRRAFSRYTNRKQFCAIGSIKTNMGHLDNAAGIAGFIKGVLALKYGKIPPSLHFNRPNGKISFEDSPVYINNKLSEWKPDGFPKRCGISSFGLSGTNCHVVLEEAPGYVRGNRSDVRPDILTLSALNISALRELVSAYRHYLNGNNMEDMKDICYTANTGRGHYNCRLAVVAANIEELKHKLNQLDLDSVNSTGDGVFFADLKIPTCGDDHKVPKEVDAAGLNEKAKAKISESLAQGNQDIETLKEICELYVHGAQIDWEAIYSGQKRFKVRLPGYPFQRNRCWLKVPEVNSKTVHAEQEGLFHTVVWKPDERQGAAEISKAVKFVIFKDGTGKAEKIAQQLREEGREVTEVQIGNTFEKIGQNSYSIRSSGDYEELFTALQTNQPVFVVHMQTITDRTEISGLEELEESQDRGVFSLLYIVQAICSTRFSPEINLVLISDYANHVSEAQECVKPENATLFGMGRVIGQENPNLKCKCIDIDKSTRADDMIMEMAYSCPDYQVAFRNGKRYVEMLVEADVDSLKTRTVDIKAQGVYVITGGTGGIGLEVARHLASRSKVTLALVNRSPMPDRSQWQSILDSGLQNKMYRKVKTIKEIEESGSRVVCYSADIAKYEEVAGLLDELRSKYGCINGIVHSAGVAGDGFLVRKDREAFSKVLEPKVRGTFILDQLTRQDDLDFFILCSSLTSLTGGPGQGDYTAANAYLDSFAAYGHRRNRKTIAINWASWKQVGMAADYGVDIDGIFKVLPADRAIEAFRKVMETSMQRVVIGEINYHSEIWYQHTLPMNLSEDIRRQIEGWKGKISGGITQENSGNRQDMEIRLTGSANGNYSPEERVIAQAWGNVLGFESINIHDDFYELGGDSILAMKIINHMNRQPGAKLEVADLLSFPTIHKLAECMHKKHPREDRKEDVGFLLQPGQKKEHYCLSSTQKRMAILNQLDQSSTAYNMPTVMLVEGDLDRGRLEQAFKSLVKRHETFRTSFKFIEGEPVQIIHEEAQLDIDFIELRSKGEGYDEILRPIMRDFIRPFDIGKAPLLRVMLVKLEDTKHVILYDMHHMIADGTSESIISRDFAMLYHGQELPELKLQFKDYCQWQKEFLESDLIKEQEAYWLQAFSGDIPVLDMPTDYHRPPVQSFEGHKLNLEVQQDTRQKIQELASETGTTLYMILLAAYNVLLSKYTGQEDIVVGSPISGRSHADLENVIGVFLNVLPMRNYPRQNLTFREFLESVKHSALKAYENQHYQMDILIDKIGLKRDTSRNPLFDTTLVLLNVDGGSGRMEIGGLSFRQLQLEDVHSKFDISIYAHDVEEKLKLSIIYCTKLFSRKTMEKFGERFIRMIREIAENPDRKLAEIETHTQEKKSRFQIFNEGLDDE